MRFGLFFDRHFAALLTVHTIVVVGLFSVALAN